MALLSLEAIRDGIRSDPSFYPQNIDLARLAILVLKLDEAAFRAASFLDDRILSPQLQGRWASFGEIEALLPQGPPQRPLHFIFHTGHVGSTLVSRLLDDAPGVLGLREPSPLRTLTTALGEMNAPHALLGPSDWKKLLDLHLACWGRGYADTRSVVVKATSSAGPCCQPILEALPEARAVLLSLQPEPYLATLLAGENSSLDLRGQAQERMKRLVEVAPAQTRPLHALSLGEIAAMTWAIETLTHRAAERRFGERLLRVDFDGFLTAPGDGLRRICAHFGIAAPEWYFADILQNPILTRYSKAPEHAYSPDLRRRILAESRSRHADEIRRGMEWIETFARQHPALGAALSA
jgi:hypothetical protein